MSSTIHDEKSRKKCQVFTPPQIARHMLDLAGYTHDLRGKRVLENSCGDGAFLIPIVERYIRESINRGVIKADICEGLQQDIWAYEIDKSLSACCMEKLNSIAEQYGISDVKWNVICDDFLKANIRQKFDYIIGNPPYIAYTDLSDKDRLFLRQSFQTCKKGKFDYSYAFIEKSQELLNDKGRLAYIIPSNFFKNVFAEDMRQSIKGDLVSIIDFSNEVIFKGVLVAPAVICLEKNSKSPSLCYQVSFATNAESRSVSKDLLIKKWLFYDSETRSHRVGDYFKVSNSIATLCNKAFIIKDYLIDGDYCLVDRERIEVSVLKRAASPKSKRYSKNYEYIIFPYFYKDDGTVGHYTEEEIRAHYPKAIDYLGKFKKALLNRDADDSAKWYEYGRSQALQRIKQRKIMISSVISDKTEPYIIEEDEVPYAGLFIVQTNTLSLETLYNALLTRRFKEYVERVGVKVSGSSKRISARDLENFTF